MDLHMDKSRRSFIKGVALGSAGILLGSSVVAGSEIEFPAPMVVQMIPCPEINIYNIDISPLTGRIAVAAGDFDESTTPDIAHIKLYVQSETEKEKFDIYWEVDKYSSFIDELRWSPDERHIAFLASTLDVESKTGDSYLYTVDVSDGNIKKVLLVANVEQNKENSLVNIDENGAFGWFDNDHICLTKKDFSIITVNRNTGEIKTIITPPSEHKIDSLVAIQPGRIRFLRRSFAEKIIEVFEYDGTNIVSKGAIPGNYSMPARLFSNGKYASVLIRIESGKSERIVNLETFEIIKQFETIAKDDSSYYFYMPVAVLNGNQIMLLEVTKDTETRKFISSKVVTTSM